MVQRVSGFTGKTEHLYSSMHEQKFSEANIRFPQRKTPFAGNNFNFLIS